MSNTVYGKNGTLKKQHGKQQKKFLKKEIKTKIYVTKCIFQ